MKSARLITLLLILISLSCSKKTTEPSQPNPKLSFDPASTELSTGLSAQVRLRMENFAQPIFAASFQIAYNESKISVADSLVAGLENIFGENAIQFIRVDSSIIRLSITKIQGDTAISGSGIICGFNITGTSAGVCSLAVLTDESYFYDIDGDIVTIDSLAIYPAIITVN
jgi:hypothetical protein